MKKIIISLSLLILLVGCSTITPPPLMTSTGRHPQLNEEVETTEGSVLFSEWNYTSQPAAIFSTTGLIVPCNGTLKDGRESYCIYDGYQGYDGWVDMTVCYYSNDGKNFTSRYNYSNLTEDKVIRPIPFTKTEIIKDGLKYELIYNGVENGSIKLNYRQYQKDISIPTYIFMLHYPISTFPTTINIEKINTTIEVLSIRDNVIRYKVLSSRIAPQGQPQQPAQSP